MWNAGWYLLEHAVGRWLSMAKEKAVKASLAMKFQTNKWKCRIQWVSKIFIVSHLQTPLWFYGSQSFLWTMRQTIKRKTSTEDNSDMLENVHSAQRVGRLWHQRLTWQQVYWYKWIAMLITSTWILHIWTDFMTQTWHRILAFSFFF